MTEDEGVRRTVSGLMQILCNRDIITLEEWEYLGDAMKGGPKRGEPKTEGMTFGDVLNLMVEDLERRANVRCYAREGWPDGRYIYVSTSDPPYIATRAEDGQRFPYAPNPVSLFAKDWRVVR